MQVPSWYNSTPKKPLANVTDSSEAQFDFVFISIFQTHWSKQAALNVWRSNSKDVIRRWYHFISTCSKQVTLLRSDPDTDPYYLHWLLKLEYLWSEKFQRRIISYPESSRIRTILFLIVKSKTLSQILLLGLSGESKLIWITDFQKLETKLVLLSCKMSNLTVKNVEVRVGVIKESLLKELKGGWRQKLFVGGRKSWRCHNTFLTPPPPPQ